MLEQPSERSVRTALARLVAGGLDSVWLPQVQPLLELPVVRAKLDDLGEDRAPEALQAALVEAVSALGQSQYRNLLEIVLGLDPEYAELSAGEKREIAGRKFRGGHRPVTAGTIRQHHEPRALDELAAALVAPSGRGRVARRSDEPTQERVAWHPAARQAWAQEHLTFWRLALVEYHRADATRHLREVMQRTGVQAWTMHEMLGVFDVFLKVWLPAKTTVGDFEKALFEVLGGNLAMHDPFSVDQVITHWPWLDGHDVMRAPDPELLSASLPARELELLNAGDESTSRKYLERDVLARVQERTGIGFVTTVTSMGGHPLVSSAAKEGIQQAILRTMKRAPEAAILEKSLFRGFGFADYLLQGRVASESFHDLGHYVLDPLDADLRAVGCRTRTFVLSTPFAVVRESRLDVDAPPREELGVREWLERGEGPELAIRPRALSDPPPPGSSADGTSGIRAQATKSLLRTLTAFLNGGGGTLIVGALQRDLEQHPLWADSAELADAPAVGGYLVLGIDREMGGDSDRFLREVRQMCAKHIQPDPNMLIEIGYETFERRTLCVLTTQVPDRGSWFYFQPSSKDGADFIVRRDFKNAKLVGAEADAYKRRNPRGF